jgi:DNA polymerase III epsilon subunit-like protein
VGHNPHFDREFIATKAKRLGLKVHFPYHKIDTVTLGYEHLAPLGLPYLSLSKRGGVCDFLGIPVEKAHEALDDVRRTAKVFFMLDKATWFDRLRWRFNWWWRRNLKISEVTGSIPDSGVA